MKLVWPEMWLSFKIYMCRAEADFASDSIDILGLDRLIIALLNIINQSSTGVESVENDTVTWRPVREHQIRASPSLLTFTLL